MRRDMSYRKPVPAYIPSPPHSPLSKQEELDYDSSFPPVVPPLPSEWREAIERVLSSDHYAISYPPPASSPSCSSESGALHGQCQRVSESNHDLDCSIFSRRTTLITRGSMFSAVGFSQEERPQRHLHHIYRPPTPPLPTYKPKRRKTDLESGWWDPYTTLSEIHHKGRVTSTAMRLQTSRSTGRTLIATPVTEGRPKSFYAPMSPYGERETTNNPWTWTGSLKRVCDVLVTNLEKGMKWLRC